MPQHEIPADSYDLYVLGLLEGQALTDLEKHLADGCVECLARVRRSLDLWVVFASTLEEGEPSADLRARLIRLAELSKRVIVFPKPAEPVERPKTGFRVWLITAASVFGAMLVVGAWYAGHQSGNIEARRLSGEMNQLTQELTSTQVLLENESVRRKKAETALQTSGNGKVVDQEEQMRHRLLELEAQVNQYKSVIQRQQSAMGDNMRVLNVLSSPSLHFVTMKGAEAAAGSTAYALFDQSKVLFVASNLPKLSEDKQFQLWLLRKQEPKVVSAGVFAAGEDGKIVVEFSDGAPLTEVAQLAVTDEPKGGSSAPTGSKLFVGSSGEE